MLTVEERLNFMFICWVATVLSLSHTHFVALFSREKSKHRNTGSPLVKLLQVKGKAVTRVSLPGEKRAPLLLLINSL